MTNKDLYHIARARQIVGEEMRPLVAKLHRQLDPYGAALERLRASTPPLADVDSPT